MGSRTPPPARRRHARRSAGVLGAAALAAVTLCCATASARTVVTLGFDDSAVNWSVAAPLLESFGMRGTFYANSCLLQGPTRNGQPISCPGGAPMPQARAMSWAQLADLYARGHEIGSHTQLRAYNLPDINQICPDRANLLAQGFAATSFAYASPGLPIEQEVVRGCGFNSARLPHGIRSARCPTCPVAETIPPGNPFALRAVEQGVTDTPATYFEQAVANAAAGGGGWVQFIFNDVCDTCRHRTPILREFLTWLRDSAPPDTVVEPSDQVIGGRLQPVPGMTPSTIPTPRQGSGVAAAKGDTVAPRLLSLSLTRRAFTRRQGTVLRYTTSERARVRITIQRRVPGRRSAGVCRATTRTRLPRAARCLAYKTVGTLTYRSPTLRTRLTIRGKRAARIRVPGIHRFRLVATDGAGNASKPRAITFRLKPSRSRG